MGAEPLALTDCLNFGNPEREEVSYQLTGCVEGMAMACEAFGIPVISGNVSLYNETRGAAVWPTPVVGALGLLEDAGRSCDTAFGAAGREVVLLGAAEVSGEAAALGGSAYLEAEHGVVAGAPSIDLDLEGRVQRAVPQGRSRGAAGVGARLLGRRAGGGPGRELHRRRRGLPG